jgi:hypothetical protein
MDLILSFDIGFSNEVSERGETLLLRQHGRFSAA